MRDLPPVERFVRRSKVYGGRIVGMLSQRALRHPCAFMHVPKCGGTSLSEALYALVPLHREIGVIDSPSIRRALALHHLGRDDLVSFHDEGDEATRIAAFREQLLLMHMAHDAHLIHGHFLFSETAFRHFGQRYKFVTMLREPVERTLSNFAMASRRREFTGDFDAFLGSETGQRMATHNLRFFSGFADVPANGQSEALARAKANLPRFAVGGFIGAPRMFASRFHDVFGKTPQIGHVNRAAGSAPAITADQRRKLERLCAPDLEIHETARAAWS